MDDKKVVYYPVADEKLGEPKLKVDSLSESEIEKAAKIICDYTGIYQDTIIFFLKNFGIDTILNNPSIMGVTPEQELKIKDLQILLSKGE